MRRTSGEWLRLFPFEVRITLVVLLFAVPLAAQRPVPGTPSNDPRDPENQQSTNKGDMRNREWLMGHSRTLARKGGSGPETSALPQIKEDFERIQLIEREMMKSVFLDNLADYQQILKTTAEIRKRAIRLKANLAYPEPLDRNKTHKSRPGNSDEDMKVSLTNLDQSMISFVMNPIFQLQQQVVETRLATKAIGDLMDIIELSELTKRHAERLRELKRERSRSSPFSGPDSKSVFPRNRMNTENWIGFFGHSSSSSRVRAVLVN